jgi:hypothetical protein
VHILELGGANVALMHWWRANVKDTPLRYTGIEPFKPFVEHANANFPESDMIEGDAEAFIDMDLTDRAPFTAFVAATVFCMIHPDVVRRCMHKAAQLADDILLRDYLINIQGGITKDGIVAFDYYRRPTMPMMFAHRYDDYFGEIGFKVLHIEETLTDVDLPGWGLVHLQRAPR